MAKRSGQQVERKSSAQLATDMQSRSLTKIIEDELAKAGNQYQQQIQQVEQQIENAPSGSKQALRDAKRALEEAADAEREPIKKEIAKAIATVANDYRLPLRVDTGGSSDGQRAARSSSDGGKPAEGWKSWVLRQVKAAGQDGITAGEIKQQAEAEGLNATSATGTIQQLKKAGEIQPNPRSDKQRNVPLVAG
jgi:hypothetical protein